MEIGISMARSDFYERYPAMLEADLADAGLSLCGLTLRALRMVYESESAGRARERADAIAMANAMGG